MVVHNVGSGLATVFPDLDGKKINDAFLLARPLVEFTWNMVRHYFIHVDFRQIVFMLLATSGKDLAKAFCSEQQCI